MKFFGMLMIAAFGAMTVVPAIASQGAAPLDVVGATTITSEQAYDKFDEGVVFVDTRKDSDFDAGRIPDAVHLDVKTALTEEALAEEVAKTDEVVFYCNGVNCKRSAAAAEMAVGWGYENVFYFRDGFPVWKSAGYPVE